MVGELPDPERAGGLALREGDAIALVGPFAPSPAGSELAKLRGELGPGLPEASIGDVAAAIRLVRDAVRDASVSAAHDISDGGLACALAEMAIAGGVGGEVDIDGIAEDELTALFGEGVGGFVVTGDRATLETLGAGEVAVRVIGRAGGDRLRIGSLDVLVADAEQAWRSLGEHLDVAYPAV
jgi:phosphoribosylformylglycinamidine synthase